MPKAKTANNNELKRRINQYEASKKAELVTLGQSTKSYKDILSYLNNEIEMSTKMADFHHKILCFREDGVYQLNKSIEKIYGVSSAKNEEKPSGGGDKPIQTVDVTLANGTRVKVPYGKIDMPDLGEGAMIDIAYEREKNFLHIKGSCQFRFASMIDDIVEETRILLKTSSIYKDQAVELGAYCEPTILDLSNIDREFMVLSQNTEVALRPLLTRINKPEECIKRGIPLKTGILLEGKYGTGKTLLAFKVAKQAIENNWSFIYLKEPKLLAQTLRLSKSLDNNGNGVIVFLEDVDQITRGNRDASMQDILNTLDGGDTKDMNVIAMFTTNHIELIEPTFLRGKRIGSIVSMGHLEAQTAYDFIQHTFADYTIVEEGMMEVCKEIEAAEIVPAFMAEITEKTKANLLFEKDTDLVKAEHIRSSFKSYIRQVELAQTKDMSVSPSEELGNALTKVLGTAKIEKNTEAILENI
jgi:transitional endoplasmic reticulum ATPase